MLRIDVLKNYRLLLRKAQYFPSMNKEGIIQSIKEDFRSYKDEENPKRVEEQIEMAMGGMKRLDEYIMSFVDSSTIKDHHKNFVITEEGTKTQWNFKLT